MAAILTRYGYPKVPGDSPESILDVPGPPTYTPLVAGSPGPPIVPPSGGQRITAQDFGLQTGLVSVVGLASQDGKYFPLIVPLMVEPAPNPPLPTQLPDGSFSTFLLVWVDVANGGQASGDLSKSTIRLLARGI